MGLRSPDQPLRGITVLVVDDHEDARYVMSSYLTHFGAHTLTATGGAAALRLLKTVRTDVVITDISMPGMDGSQLLQEVRRLPGQSDRPTPIIACTAFSHLRDSARQAGFAAYLVKPLDPFELVRQIGRLVLE